MCNISGAPSSADLHPTLVRGHATVAPDRNVSDAPRGAEPVPPIDPALAAPNVFGNCALIKLAHDGGDVGKVFRWCKEQVRIYPGDPSYLLDLALLHLLEHRHEEAYRVQAQALGRQKLFRVAGTTGEQAAVRRRVLALLAPGDFMNNALLEFILDGSDVGLDVLYVVPGEPLPPALPEHDVVFCAANESDENVPVLRRIAALLPAWPRPVLNLPQHVERLSRHGLATLFDGDPHVHAPPARRAARADLQRLAAGASRLDALLPGGSYPVLVRPVGSHGGKSLEKIDGTQDLTRYLQGLDAAVTSFFLATFVDYRSPDGQYRKYRIALIDGTPFVCHMAVSSQWKIHYVNAGMAESADKRAEEALVMETFDDDFAVRHRGAFESLCRRVGLDYFIIDCGESPDGRLLLFEAETAMIVHNLDSPATYPYKTPQMARVFGAFRSMIDRAALLPPGVTQGRRLRRCGEQPFIG